MYTAVSTIFGIIRLFYIPNPFEQLEGTLSPFILNLACEPLLHVVTFSIVGMFYNRGSVPALGSCLYMLFYAVHVGVIMAAVSAYCAFKSWVAMVVVFFAYIALLELAVQRFGNRYW